MSTTETPRPPVRWDDRALHRYPQTLATEDTTDRTPYRLHIAVRTDDAATDSRTLPYLLTEAEADQWQADVTELLSLHRDGHVWFVDDDGDRLSVAVRDILFTNMNSRGADDRVAEELGAFMDGMGPFLSAEPPPPSDE